MSNQPLLEKVNGVSITAYSKNNLISRVVTMGFSDYEKFSAEWYFDRNELIFVYQTFEYFEEVKEKGNWQNFKGLWGWESRLYFRKEELVYHKHKGRTQVRASDVLKSANGILSYINKKSKD